MEAVKEEAARVPVVASGVVQVVSVRPKLHGPRVCGVDNRLGDIVGGEEADLHCDRVSVVEGVRVVVRRVIRGG